MFYALGIFFISFILLLFIYIISRFRKYYLLSKVTNKKVEWFLSIIPAIIFTIYIIVDRINGIVVLLHLSLFSLICDLIFKVIEKIKKKEFKYYYSGVCAIVITVVYFAIASFFAYHVYETKYEINTSKDLGTESFRIVQISDSHLGPTMSVERFSSYIDKINNTEPDVIFITGDFIDDDTPLNDMIEGCKALGKLKSKYGTYYINGNHDKGYFNGRKYTYDDLKSNLSMNGVHILEDEIVNLNENIVVIGRLDSGYKERIDIASLVDRVDKDDYIIVLDHKPDDYEAIEKTNADLVLSGHTHGGHIFPIGQIAVLFGINDSRYGLETRGNTNFIVNSGISGWAIKFKTGAISEYGIIDISSSR